jgi:hypothetical protein
MLSENQSGGSDSLKIFPLRNEDLVFSKNCDGIVSCGYKVSNALLNATLGMPMVGGGKHKSNKNNNNNNNNNNEIKTAKIMEDLVVPSSLYYHKPTTKDKVFNYKKGKANKANKDNKDKNNKKGSRSGSDSDSDSDDNVIDESLYDKLLSLVSSDKRVKYDKKTRKIMDKHEKGVKEVKEVKEVKGESRKSGENTKIKIKKTRKVKFNT